MYFHWLIHFSSILFILSFFGRLSLYFLNLFANQFTNARILNFLEYSWCLILCLFDIYVWQRHAISHLLYNWICLLLNIDHIVKIFAYFIRQKLLSYPVHSFRSILLSRWWLLWHFWTEHLLAVIGGWQLSKTLMQSTCLRRSLFFDADCNRLGIHVSTHWLFNSDDWHEAYIQIL